MIDASLGFMLHFYTFTCFIFFFFFFFLFVVVVVAFAILAFYKVLCKPMSPVGDVGRVSLEAMSV